MLCCFEGLLMPLVRTAVILLFLLAAGCAGMDRSSQVEPSRTGATKEKEPPWLLPQQPVEKQEKAVVAKPEPAAPQPDVPAVVEPAPPAAVAPATVSTSQSDAKPDAPAVKPPARAPVSPAPKKERVAPPAKEIAAPPAPRPTVPPLDLAALEKRLKETEAIGVFTKLTLKNQVDALLDQFRAYYQGRTKTTLAALRQPYDQLLLKVLSLLQDSDPPLARAIVESREAIWGILSNPEKFKNL